MPANNYDDYVYFNTIIDATKEHHNQIILNQELDFYTTSLTNLMDDTFKSLPKLFVDIIIKYWMNSHIKVVAQ